jgi:hypothetical protein
MSRFFVSNRSSVRRRDRGDIFYGPTKKISDTGFQLETLVVARLFANHDLKELNAAANIIALPRSYRSTANPVQINCVDRKVLIPKYENFNEGNVWLVLDAPAAVQPFDVKEDTPFGMLLNLVCGIPVPTVAGTYEGTHNATYKGAQGEQNISFTVEQNGSEVKVSYPSR